MNDKRFDYRTVKAPVDRLAMQSARQAKHAKGIDLVGDFKTEADYVQEFIAEISGQRCEPGCANGQPKVDCICSLLEQMTETEAPLVPKDEFTAVVTAAGYNLEQAMGHYRNYAQNKLDDQHKHDFRRLITENHNAYNWWLELGSRVARRQMSETQQEIMAIESKIEAEIEAIMSA